ncbi:PcfJ domain-containing protein [Mesorhizobium sp. B2-4-17]|uniref:PcfJ domain-containing protein n=1 Tax=Mesorhizobium sp. B2-4-17 TaxID=2589932 RepID=UPI00112B8F56|nr:PcfJ domain-containing protein [Mesorhizobium sp. B2-4-17]TPK91479.1 hypothetical protein FJ548_04365 [Mesorhizobium sp. B2-4-17]
MNLKGLLPQDVEFLNEWLDQLRALERLGQAEAYLVRHSILRIAANNIRGEYPKKPSEGWSDPMPRIEQLSHIVDWLRADLYEGAPWLGNLDQHSRPKKLMKCGTYDDLVREADRAMDRRNGGIAKALGPDDEEFVSGLGDGYKLVRMLTPEALDLESRRMHHCIGHGSYDGRLRAGWGRYLSVRDSKKRPVVTIELRQEANARWSISQIQGRHNGRPARLVMEALRPYTIAQGWRDREIWWPVVTAEDGTVYDVDRIPAGTTIRGDLDVGSDVVDMLGVFTLPTDLTVLGDVTVSPKLCIPENLTVSGFLEIERRDWMIPDDYDGVVLPESLHVDMEIRISMSGDLARPIPTHMYSIIKIMGRERLESLKWTETDEGLDDGDRAPSRGPSC